MFLGEIDTYCCSDTYYVATDVFLQIKDMKNELKFSFSLSFNAGLPIVVVTIVLAIDYDQYRNTDS